MPSQHYQSLFTRRQAVSLGATAFGLTLPRLWASEVTNHSTPRAKSVIILYLSGGPSQLDMWDMKPSASEEVRGTFKPISTNLPGLQICEHLPRMARVADKYTIVRSMSHDESEHLRAGHWVMTGHRLVRPVTAFSGLARNDHPHVGAVISHSRPAQKAPSFVVVPEFVSPREVPRPGQHAGFLGPAHDPYLIHSDPSQTDYSPGPILGSRRNSPQRLSSVRELLNQIQQDSRLHSHANAQSVDVFHQRAFDLIGSPKVQKAFDLSQEPTDSRARYGDHIFCQSTLVARRLVEAGVRLVQVNFIRHDGGPGGQGYDSHSVPPYPQHLKWAKESLLPPTDAAFATLIEDLSDRRLLDETLVVMMGEFGRTPRFNNNGGRDHWPGCYSLVLAGGGTAGGHVYGRSDKFAAVPVTDPVSPNDLLATVYHLMGVDYHQTFYDLENRPHGVCTGKPVSGVLA